MSQRTPITYPAKYVNPTAVGFSNNRGELSLVTALSPLPVTFTEGGGAAPTPLAGQAAKSAVVGPFTPNPRVPMHLQLGGTWKGSVTLERSVDGGKTRQGLTVVGARWASFSGNVNEPVWEESDPAATFWLNIVLDSGQVTYRLS